MNLESFSESVIEAIKAVPKGKVATYGQIAKLAGNPRAARQVARLLHSSSRKHNLPWHRIVNAQGDIVISDSEAAYAQREWLEEEGVAFIKENRVDLSSCRWEAGID